MLSDSSTMPKTEYAWPCTMPISLTSVSEPAGEPAPIRYPLSKYSFTS